MQGGRCALSNKTHKRVMPAAQNHKRRLAIGDVETTSLRRGIGSLGTDCKTQPNCANLLKSGQGLPALLCLKATCPHRNRPRPTVRQLQDLEAASYQDLPQCIGAVSCCKPFAKQTHAMCFCGSHMLWFLQLLGVMNMAGKTTYAQPDFALQIVQ